MSPDGKRCRTVLGESDGIDRPYAIYFDKVKNNLVVCNYNGRNSSCLTNSDILLSDSCTLEIPLDSSQNKNDPSLCVIP
jgi:hypothetical protein